VTVHEALPVSVAQIGATSASRTRWQLVVKRLLDVAVSCALLVALLPLIVLIALAIRLQSRGPVLFCQRRVGRGGRTFTMFKFRTMVVGADRARATLMERSTDPHWLALERDPRVTSLGHVLRITSLDELPQLWHVLRGQMSLVGPRPLVESEAGHLSAASESRHCVRPGLTGLWQVSGRTAVSFEEMVRLDCAYVEAWSLREDLMVLLRTIPAVLARKGAN
jgi:lipopolysaccharide/colanic/teichoic acid biosynthesis glycosyltransferase